MTAAAAGRTRLRAEGEADGRDSARPARLRARRRIGVGAGIAAGAKTVIRREDGMIYQTFGDRLPAVGVVQRMMNECRKKDARLSGIEELVEDGIFGSSTRAAVRTAQGALGLKDRSGILGPDTWRALAAIGGFRIVDVTDLAIEALMKRKGRAQMHMDAIDRYVAKYPHRSRQEAETFAATAMRKYDTEIKANRDQHNRFVSMGGNPIGITSLEDVFGTIRRGLEERSRDGARIVLLRFTGHGSPASQGVAGSMVGGKSITGDTLSFDDHDTAEDIIDTVVLSGMTLPMAPFGCVELHGCNVGARRVAGHRKKKILLNGPAYVQNFANVVGRPVSASVISDYYGTVKLDTRYEGAVVNCVPGGGGVQDWFKQH
jgi:hypothetical protein